MLSSTQTGNPVAEVRKRCGLSRAAFSRATGCAYQQLTRAEGGYVPRLLRAVRDALASTGIDVQAADRQYEAWLRSLRCGVPLREEQA
jgi:hypothetical protein